MSYFASLWAGLSVLVLTATLAACGANEEDKKTSTAASYDFTKDIEPILARSCSGEGTCHGQGEGEPVYIGDEGQVVANAADAINRIVTSDASLQMPKPGYGIELSEGDKEILLDYLAAKK